MRDLQRKCEMGHATTEFENNDRHCNIVSTNDRKEGNLNKWIWESNLAQGWDYCTVRNRKKK